MTEVPQTNKLCVPGLLERQYGFTSHVPVSRMNFKVMHWREQEVRRTGESCQAVLHRGRETASQHWSCECLGCFNVRAGFRHCAVVFRLKLLCHLSWSV